MSIQISNIDQANLLQDLNTADSNAVVGGTSTQLSGASISVPSIPAIVSPTITTSPTGTVTSFGITNTGINFGAGVGFASANGSGTIGASSSSTSTTTAAGSTATAAGGGFTGGTNVGITFDRT